MYQLPDKEDRMELVKRLFDEEKAGKVHILKKNIGDLKAELYLCITPESGLLRFAVPSKNVLKDISLEESGLVSVFYDFCENLSPELFYSEELFSDKCSFKIKHRRIMRVHIIRTEFFGRKSRKALFFIAQK